MGKLDGQVALVTGGGRGLGRAYVLRLAGLGADVVVNDIDLAAAKEYGEELTAPTVMAEVEAMGRRSLGIQADATKRDQVRDMIDRFQGAPRGHHPADLLPGARSVVVVAHRFFQSVLDCDRFGRDSELIPQEDLWEVQETNFMSLYNTANMRLQMVTTQLATLLEDRGYAALPLPAGGYKVGAGRYAHFSHRHAAVAAGLGEFGLNNLLLTPQYGPRVRLDSVITTAELTPDPLCAGPICLGQEACGLCLANTACFGEIFELTMAGKTMQLARFTGGCLAQNECNRINRHATLPHSRYCWGVCPVGQTPKVQDD